jgi:hypothetical protein
VNLVGYTAVVLVVAGSEPDVTFGLSQRFSVVDRLQVGQLIKIAQQDVGQPTHGAAAFGAVRVAPGRKRLSCVSDRFVDDLSAGALNLRQDGTTCRVDGVHGGRAGGGKFLAADDGSVVFAVHFVCFRWWLIRTARRFRRRWER